MALTKVSRGLLSTGIVDNSNATAITLNADESATFAGTVNAAALTVDTNTLVVDATNNRVGIGGNSTGYKVHVFGDDAMIRMQNTGSGTNGFLDLAVNSTEATINANYSASAIPLRFITGASERMRITGSDGHFLVGNTVTNPASGFNNQKGFAYAATTGQVQIATNSNNAVIELGKNNANDGDLVVFRKQSSQAGSIGVQSTRLTVGSSGGSGLRFDSANVMPMSSGSLSNGAVDIGYSANRFRDIYLTGGINFNGSSGGINTANRAFMMSEYEIGTCTISFSTSGGGATLSRQDNATGWYQKTGDICTVQFYSGGLTFTAAGSGSARIHGLPFNARAGTYNYGVCSITHNTATTTDIQNGFTAPNLSHITITQRQSTSGGAWVTGGVRYFMFSVTYLTN